MNRVEFLDRIWPKIAGRDISAHMTDRYPAVSVTGEGVPLAQLPVVMLVALTGTGKTTTLDHISGQVRYRTDIPTRRELADWIVIPTAQILLGEPVQPVRDRAGRFRYTAAFAQHVMGGFAAAYGWLSLRHADHTPILSDGVRGHSEMGYALAHYPRWQIVELTVDLLTRLKRLTNRDDPFDTISGDDSLNALPDAIRPTVQTALSHGEISAAAVRIVTAEAAQYGLEPFAQAHPRYNRIDTTTRSPEQVAAQLSAILQPEAITYADH